MILHLTHKEINKSKWDSCIHGSLSRLPYGLSWWLDIVSPDWEALILDDYTAIMPLTWKSRLGIYYIRQPWFTQQLGVFSPDTISHAVLVSFMDMIPEKYRYIEVQLNTSNIPVSGSFTLSFRSNYVLDLTSDYLVTARGYNRNCRRNIQKALNAGLHIKKGPGPTAFSRFTERNLDSSLRKNAGLFESLPRIVQATIERECGEILGVYDRREELQAAGWFVNFGGRCLFMVCASTAAGKTNQAMHFLVDHKIRERSGSGQIFDFTGSNIPGVEYFNTGFGAVRQSYPALKMNRLPWILRWLKR